MMEEMLRSQNYQLKNEITDLKNAFNLNRDILKILSSYAPNTDPHRHLLMQIITRLTTVNNQAMLNAIELIQQKNILKQENLRLNLQIRTLEDKLEQQLESNKLTNFPTESKMMIQEQFNSLNRELLAANEERIAQENQIQHWKHNFQRLQKDIGCKMPMTERIEEKKNKIKRKYTSHSNFKFEVVNKEFEKENKRLKRYIEQLENKLLLFIKAFNIKTDSPQQNELSRRNHLFFESQRQQIRLLKYALNDVKVQRQEDEYLLTITQRFREKDVMNNVIRQNRRSFTWPKYQKPTWEDNEEEAERQKEERMWEEKIETRMTEQQY